MNTNMVSIVIPPEVLSQVLELQNQAKTLLAPYLLALTPEQRHQLPKMAERNFSFVSKTLDYALSNPEFAPKFLDAEALQTDVKAVDDLSSVEQPTQILASQLNDTIMMAGSEAYVAALAYYQSVKEAARHNVPGAKAIFEDLKVRFDQTRKRSNRIAKAA